MDIKNYLCGQMSVFCTCIQHHQIVFYQLSKYIPGQKLALPQDLSGFQSKTLKIFLILVTMYSGERLRALWLLFKIISAFTSNEHFWMCLLKQQILLHYHRKHVQKQLEFYFTFGEIFFIFPINKHAWLYLLSVLTVYAQRKLCLSMQPGQTISWQLPSAGGLSPRCCNSSNTSVLLSLHDSCQFLRLLIPQGMWGLI